ncbi:MAG: hypothetical protein Q8R67_25290 [Rhodoferax sp.]|nr:hypothetical protein [Rhodoferax sp.]MDP3654989.1 hypothetical protein [Rhodoferax sp.]
MQQKTFLTVAAAIALVVGAVAVLFPAAMLASKGTVPSAAADVWMREVGVLLVCIGVIAGLVRSHADSPTMRVLMLGNLLVQLGLLATEVLGYAHGVITLLSGLVPNAVLHLVLAAGFAYYWRRANWPTAAAVRHRQQEGV